MSLHLKKVPASRGLQWVKTGLQLALSQPLGFVSLLGLMLTVAVVLIMLPILGAVVLVMLMPLLWLLFMLAAQQAAQGKRVSPWLLAQAVRQSFQHGTRLKAWGVLGLLYAAATFLVMVLAGVLGPDMAALAKAMETASNSTQPDVFQDPILIQSLLWRMGLSWPVSLVFWHTPALLYWAGTPPIKAVFFSAVACWRNLDAFVVYVLGWVAVVLALGLPLQLIGQWIGPGLGTQILSISLGLWVIAAFYASLYVSVTDCLVWDSSPAEIELSPAP